jgi:hypothetical protein
MTLTLTPYRGHESADEVVGHLVVLHDLVAEVGRVEFCRLEDLEYLVQGIDDTDRGVLLRCRDDVDHLEKGKGIYDAEKVKVFMMLKRKRYLCLLKR